ncbi:hypothetical protein Goshw_027513 [Gossypium schwendimanii]|uniref:Uncharacterized protein n=1 Tax=Gossypium schwendimanii TaxID=34291 RepID=A0A7J9LD86_GOSSC|nr:hypothetical protein [Gossypium schwendimanii]
MGVIGMGDTHGDRKQLTSSESEGFNAASGSGHGPNWDYIWGWGSSPGSGWVMVQALPRFGCVYESRSNSNYGYGIVDATAHPCDTSKQAWDNLKEELME